MARRQDPQSSFYQGLALDFRPFDQAKLDIIMQETRKTPVVKDGPARDTLIERMNTAAQSLDHNIQIARAPSVKADFRTLERLLSHITPLRSIIPVSVDRDQGLAPGDEPRIADGLLRLLGPEMDARLRGKTPIEGWSLHSEATPDHGRSAPRESDDNLHADTVPSDTAAKLVGDEGASAELSPEASEDGQRTAREIASYDPADAASYFGADNPNDILVILSNFLALLEDSAKAAQANCADARPAKRATPEKHFIFALIAIYAEFFGRTPGTSYDPIEGTPGGPLIRFVTACLHAVAPCGADQVKSNTIRQYVVEYRGKSDGD